MRYAVLLLAVALSAACSSTGSRASGGAGEDPAAPSKLKPEPEEVPRAVRSIEPQIDQESIILAGEAEIFVSKNYEYDVSLTGDKVTKDLDKSGRNERIAHGRAIAFVRNLQIKCDRRVRVRIAGFGTEPFIRISAKGHCSHIVLDESQRRHAIRRADAIIIDNENIRYVREQVVPDQVNPASSR